MVKSRNEVDYSIRVVASSSSRSQPCSGTLNVRLRIALPAKLDATRCCPLVEALVRVRGPKRAVLGTRAKAAKDGRLVSLYTVGDGDRASEANAQQ